MDCDIHHSKVVNMALICFSLIFFNKRKKEKSLEKQGKEYGKEKILL